VWGGDFNHAMTGREYAGSRAGRGHIENLLTVLQLRVPTTHLAHRIPGLLSIDHIAVPRDSVVDSASRIDAPGLSDHDAYVVVLS
jgi:endonuclease/exonuclease/phosphatase family metal-dependent hydrolase